MAASALSFVDGKICSIHFASSALVRRIVGLSDQGVPEKAYALKHPSPPPPLRLLLPSVFVCVCVCVCMCVSVCVCVHIACLVLIVYNVTQETPAGGRGKVMFIHPSFE